MSQLQLSLPGTPGVKHAAPKQCHPERSEGSLAMAGSGSMLTTPDCGRASSGVSLLMKLPEYAELRELARRGCEPDGKEM